MSGETLDALKGRLQFLVLLATFFPVTVAALFSADADQLAGDKLILSWGQIIAALVLVYVFVEIFGRKLPEVLARWLGWASVFCAAAFAPIFWVLAVYPVTIPFVAAGILRASLVAVVVGVSLLVAMPLAVGLFSLGKVPTKVSVAIAATASLVVAVRMFFST